MSRADIDPTTVRYIATIRNVREITLVGSADLAFWRERLQPAQLVPEALAGRAQLWIGATQLIWLGIRFRELTISVVLEQPRRHSCAYLAQAFNSSRALALAERRLFGTPYEHATISADDGSPAAIVLGDGDRTVLRASMAARQQLPAHDRRWQGEIILPRRHPQQPGRCFFAQLGGPTESAPFVTSQDSLTIEPDARWPILRWLIDSDFQPGEWRICHSATHARSSTLIHRAERLRPHD